MTAWVHAARRLVSDQTTMTQEQKYLTVALCPDSLLRCCSFKDSISGKHLHIVLGVSLQISHRQTGFSRVSNINTLYLSATL